MKPTTLNTLALMGQMLDGANVPVEARRTTTASAVGVAIAYRLDVPSSAAPGALRLLFTNMHSATMIEELSDINEAISFDTALAKEIVISTWEMRYHMVHNPAMLMGDFLSVVQARNTTLKNTANVDLDVVGQLVAHIGEALNKG